MPAPLVPTDFNIKLPAETWDSNLPSVGFITDFVYATKGWATPAKFSTWTALFCIASVLKRDVWLKWADDDHKFYPNLFVCIVAGPKWWGKSTVTDDFADRVLENFIVHLPTEELKVRKHQRVLHGSVTPQALYSELSKPVNKVHLNGKTYTLKKEVSSYASVISSELGVFLNKERYNEGLIQRLDDLYSCKISDEVLTIARDKEELRDIYVCILGATTPRALDDALPKSAISDGFLSRMVIVRQRDLEKPRHRRPYTLVTLDDLGARLAWVAEHCWGEYDLSPEADTLYDEDHKLMYDRAVEDPESQETAAESRIDNLLLKTALLIRCSRYEPGNTITGADYRDARKIVFSTLPDSRSVMRDVNRSTDGRNLDKVAEWLKRHTPVERTRVLRTFSSYNINAKMINEVVNQLVAEERITITYKGHRQDQTLSKGAEIWSWIDG